MNLSFTPHHLQFIHPFAIAGKIRNSTPVVFTELRFEDTIGYGEASMPPYLGETHETVLSFLTVAQKKLSEIRSPFDIEAILQTVDNIAIGNTAAKASIDIALHDVVGKLKNRSWHQLLGLDKNKTPDTSYTIGIADELLLKQKVKESGSYKILKVKLGSDDDKKIITAIRSVTNKPISVDVNQGWKDKYVALDMINWLSEQNVIFIEQPLPKENLNDAAWLTERSPLPIIADESVQRLSDIDKLKNIFSGINIKLMKCTGMHEAYKMILLARKNNMKILLGCMSETSCAISAAAQLSPLVDWADLDGPMLIKEDYFEGVKFVEGKIILNDLPGIGVKRVEEKIKNV